MNLQELQDRVSAAETAVPNGMLKVNIKHPTGNEGVWAQFASPSDKEVYERNSPGEKFEVFLLNHALIGGPSWGARLKLNADGSDSRVSIPVDVVLQQMNEAVGSGDYPNPSEFAKAGEDSEDDDEDADEDDEA